MAAHSDIFKVLKKEGRWIVRRERDGTQATFKDRDEAVDFARQRARRARPSEIRVEDDTGKLAETIPFEVE